MLLTRASIQVMFKIDEGVTDLKDQLSETSTELKAHLSETSAKVEEVQIDVEGIRDSVRIPSLGVDTCMEILMNIGMYFCVDTFA